MMLGDPFAIPQIHQEEQALGGRNDNYKLQYFRGNSDFLAVAKTTYSKVDDQSFF